MAVFKFGVYFQWPALNCTVQVCHSAWQLSVAALFTMGTSDAVQAACRYSDWWSSTFTAHTAQLALPGFFIFLFFYFFITQQELWTTWVSMCMNLCSFKWKLGKPDAFQGCYKSADLNLYCFYALLSFPLLNHTSWKSNQQTVINCLLVAALKACLNPTLIKYSPVCYVNSSHSCGLDVKCGKRAALVCIKRPLVSSDCSCQESNWAKYVSVF